MSENLKVGDKLSDQISGRDYYEVLEIEDNEVKLQRNHYNGNNFDVWNTFTVKIEKVQNKMGNKLVKY